MQKRSKCLQQLGLYKTFYLFPFNLGNETENQIPYKGNLSQNIKINSGQKQKLCCNLNFK